MDLNDAAVRLLAGLLLARTGQQLTPSRRWRIDVALQPILRARALPSLDALLHAVALGRDDALAGEIIDALVNNETSFFRDANSFALLERAALPRLADARANERRLRLWCAGCSTGQEAYSLAMLFADQPERWAGWRIEIVATDVSATAIAAAKAGRYSQFEIQRGLAVSRMLRWFERDGDLWVVAPALRRRVRFERGNLLDSVPAPGRFDLILCRNVLLYFAGPTRGLAFARLAAGIAPDGALMLGAGETAMGHTDAFVSDYQCRGLYRPKVEEDPDREAPRNAAAA